MLTTRSPDGVADHAARVEGGAHRGEVLGGVRLAERAADRAPVADDRVGDDRLGVREDREERGELRRLQQLAVPGHRADPDLVRADPDVAELVVEVVDVDDVLEVGQPELHHRQQAVATGDEPGLAAEPLEQPDGVLDAGGAFVLERGGDLHERPPRRTAGVTAVTRLSSSVRAARQRNLSELLIWVRASRRAWCPSPPPSPRRSTRRAVPGGPRTCAASPPAGPAGRRRPRRAAPPAGPSEAPRR